MGAVGDARSAQLGAAGRRRGRRRDGAGTALVVLRVRARHRSRKQQSSNLLELAERTLQDVAEEARRILPDR